MLQFISYSVFEPKFKLPEDLEDCLFIVKTDDGKQFTMSGYYAKEENLFVGYSHVGLFEYDVKNVVCWFEDKFILKSIKN